MARADRHTENSCAPSEALGGCLQQLEYGNLSAATSTRGGWTFGRKEERSERERERCVGGDASTETGTYLVVLYSNLD